MNNTLSPIVKELREKKIIETLSYLLKQGAVKENIPVQPDGFAPLSAIVNHRRINESEYTLEEIIQHIKADKREHFTLRNLKNDLKIPSSAVPLQVMQENIDDWVIRTNLSQSFNPIDTALQLKPLYSFLDFSSPTVIYGTSIENLSLITKFGGIPGENGDYIYLTPCSLSEYNAITKTQNCNVFLYINIVRALFEGLKFYLFKENTIITKGESGLLKSTFIDKIVDKDGTGIHVNFLRS